MFKKLIVVGIAAACAISAPVSAKHFKKEFTYEVTITNLTNVAFLSKTAVATHKRKFKLFELGQKGVPLGLEILAETGKAQTLVNEMNENDDVKIAVLLKGSAPNEGLLPGETAKVEIVADFESSSVSVFSMMAPSNDAFVAANSIQVPRHGKTVTIFSPVYDAGTEANTEFCYDISVNSPLQNTDDDGLDDPTTTGIDYVFRENGPRNFIIDPDSNGLDEPLYIPVPLGARDGICRYVNHGKHPEAGGDATKFRIPAPGIAALVQPANPRAVPPIAGGGPNVGEGVVMIHRGMHGVGQLNPAMFDWRNPGAKITIKRIR